MPTENPIPTPTAPLAEMALMTISVVTTTVSSVADAERMATAALQARWAACIQVEAITSHFVWLGRQDAQPEWRVVMKTLPALVPPLMGWIRAAHPYDLPQILCREEQAELGYGQWVVQNVRQPDA